MRKTKRRKRGASTGRGLMGALFKGTQRLPAHVSDEPEWYLDGAEVKLTRVFTIVLILHLVAVGGILAFKMIEKASSPTLVMDTESAEAKQENGKVEASGAIKTAKVAAAKQAVKAPLKIERRNSLIVADPSRNGMSVYRVSSGETLVDVARDQGVTVAELRRLNNLHSGDQLYAGKWLSVPDKSDQTIGNGAAPGNELTKASLPKKTKVLKATPIIRARSPQIAHVAKPVVRKATAKPVVKKKVKSSSRNKAATYSVKSGDNLYSIARKTGVSYSTLISLNRLDKPELLQVGQVLRLSK